VVSEHIVNCVRFWARRWPARLALWCDGRPLSWSDLDQRSDRIAAGLQQAGVHKGDSVGILMRNRLEFAEVLVAIFKVGASAVLLNVRYTPKEMLHPLRDARVLVVIADEGFLPALGQALTDIPRLRVFVTENGVGRETLDSLRAEGPAPSVELDGEDIALICYTSGTTGTPKGAMISHYAICSGAAARSMATGLTFNDRVLLPLPLAYTGGAVMLLRDGIVPGSSFYLTNDVSAENMLRLIETERITMMSSVTVLFEMMMNHPKFATTDVSSLRHATTGGAVVTLHLLRTWQDRGVALTQSYGLTESAGTFMTILFPDEAERKIGFAGRPLPQVQLKIVDSEGRTLPPHASGEILVRSPAVMSGYLNMPQQTAETLRDGWLHTGDIGFLDEEGYLRIVDRLKDMLISGGLNVYPAEVEKALASLPGLGEFTVIGVPDERWGEVPMLVAASLDAVDIRALRERCRSDLADYKRPKYAVSHGSDLPRTFSGKITKPLLRQMYEKVPEKAISLKG
jgi:fatty-acyl-CoA synthase